MGVVIGCRTGRLRSGADVPRALALAVFLVVSCLACCAFPSGAFGNYDDVATDYPASQDLDESGDVLTGSDIPDGTYVVTAVTTSYMCKFYDPSSEPDDNNSTAKKKLENKCRITVSGDSIVATFYISKAYTALYFGTAEEAATLTDDEGTDSSAYLLGSPKTGYVYRLFSIPVAALNKSFKLATYTGGQGFEDGVWYNREVLISSSDEIAAAIAGGSGDDGASSSSASSSTGTTDGGNGTPDTGGSDASTGEGDADSDGSDDDGDDGSGDSTDSGSGSDNDDADDGNGDDGSADGGDGSGESDDDGSEGDSDEGADEEDSEDSDSSAAGGDGSTGSGAAATGSGDGTGSSGGGAGTDADAGDDAGPAAGSGGSLIGVGLSVVSPDYADAAVEVSLETSDVANDLDEAGLSLPVAIAGAMGAVALLGLLWRTLAFRYGLRPLGPLGAGRSA